MNRDLIIELLTHYCLDISVESLDEDDDIFITEPSTKEFTTLKDLIDVMLEHKLTPSTRTFQPMYPDVYYRYTEGNKTWVLFPHGMSIDEKKLIFLKVKQV